MKGAVLNKKLYCKDFQNRQAKNAISDREAVTAPRTARRHRALCTVRLIIV